MPTAQLALNIATIPTLQPFFDDVSKLISYGFRFSTIHNPEERYIIIKSATQPDKIKHIFKNFNIYLGNSGDKIVEKYFYY